MESALKVVMTAVALTSMFRMWSSATDVHCDVERPSRAQRATTRTYDSEMNWKNWLRLPTGHADAFLTASVSNADSSRSVCRGRLRSDSNVSGAASTTEDQGESGIACVPKPSGVTTYQDGTVASSLERTT